MGLDAVNLEPSEAVTGPAEPPVEVEAVQVEEQPPALMSRPRSLAQMLRSSGKLDDDQIVQTEEAAHRGGIPFAQALVRNGLMLPWDLAAMTALHMGVPLLDLRGETIDLDAVSLLPEQLALHYLALPIRSSGRQLTVAMTDPTDVGTMQDLSARTGRTIDPVIATVDHIVEHIDLSYRSAKVTQGQALGMGQAVARVTAAQLNLLPPADVMELLVRQALQDRASDVHLEPTEAHLRVRYRIDGILHDVMSLPLDLHPALISRLKIVSGLNIAERRRPQDGQFSLAASDRTVDVRVAISSTVTGEMAVLRLLEKQFDLRGLDQLGMLPDSIDKFRKLLRLPYGIIIVCGPTGAGKSTTLYASVLQMDRIEMNVISLEDPVEYHIADANQMQVHPEAGVTFATQLRSILRLDPDVILVGEVRDQETALIATQAALTGHLVLTSLHANDSVSALLRLRDLGVASYLIASSVAGIVSQRMVRRVCSNCGTMQARPIAEQEAYAAEMGEDRDQFVYGGGCNACAHTGYRGRSGVYEVLTMTDELRELFSNDASREQLLAQARADGMVSMRRDGMLKVREGTTTPYEMLRVLFSLD